MSTKTVDAVIIGAGIAGIAAAASLESAGRTYVLLEGRNRIGGRLFTDRESGSAPYELGCSWYHQTLDNPLFKMALDLGLSPTYDDVGPNLYDNNGPLNGDLKLPQAASDFAPWLELYFKQHPELVDISLQEAIKTYVSKHLSLTEVQKKEVRRILEILILPNGSPADQVSAKYGALPGLGRDALATGGYDRLLEHIAKPISKKNIHLNTSVKEIQKLKDSTVSVISDQDEKFIGKYAIVTVPIGVLQSSTIKFTPELPGSIIKSINGLGISDIGKVYFEFESVFWPVDSGKFMFVGDLDGQYTPVLVSNWYLFNGEKRHPGVFLILPSPLMRKLENDNSKAFPALKPVLESIRVDRTKAIPQPTKVTVTSWGTDKFTNGAVSRPKIGVDPTVPISGFEQGAGSIRFAGEHTTVRGYTFAHGAYLSGKREADVVIENVPLRNSL